MARLDPEAMKVRGSGLVVRAKSFYGCVQILLPMLHGGQLGHFPLQNELQEDNSWKTLSLECIRAFTDLLNNGMSCSFIRNMNGSEFSSIPFRWCLRFLELAIHCQRDVTQALDSSDPRHQVREMHRLVCGQHNLTSPYSRLDEISRFVRAIRMYNDDPQSRRSLLDYLGNLRDGTTDQKIRDTIDELCMSVRDVRSLMFFCRLRIVQQVQGRDVRQLALPRLLQNYILVGDISPDHVAYEAIA